MKRALLLAAGLLAVASAGAADLYLPGTANDPHVRAAKYLNEDQRFLSSIVELRGLDHDGDALRMPSEYQWRLAEAYLAFGMRDKAEALYRQLAVTTTDHTLLARARLRLAEFEYQRGYLPEARATLMRMREQLPDGLVEDWQDELARVLMAEGRYGEAVEVLTELNNARKQSPYARYNLGIALINGRGAQGQTVMDKVGSASPKTAEDLALRDRANLTLGWYFLQNRQGGTAKPIFSRVRLEGPFSNRALLGLGWTELSPTGAKAERVEVGDEQPGDAGPFTTFSTLGVLLRPGFLDSDVFSRSGLHAFRLFKAKPEEQEALRRALAVWVELISRDPMDPAVQEAWLAIPYSLDKLGAHIEALQYYEKAVAVLEKGRARIDEANASIKQGRMVETIVRRDMESEAGWEWKLKDLPDAPETYFLQSLLAEHRFQEALKNYRDVRLLARSLDSWNSRLQEITASYLHEDRPRVVIDELVERARANWTPPWAGLSIHLRAEGSLSAPGTYDARAPRWQRPPALLQFSAVPKRFNGPIERAASLKARIGDLRAQTAAAGGEQGRLLQDMALKELDGQKKQIERYLVEARFALARLYDRQSKGTLNDE
jgi:tetratricopeptide (TPR) repeat protein